MLIPAMRRTERQDLYLFECLMRIITLTLYINMTVVIHAQTKAIAIESQQSGCFKHLVRWLFISYLMLQFIFYLIFVHCVVTFTFLITT